MNINWTSTARSDLKRLDKGVYRFEGAIPCMKTGRQGFTVRVLPHHPDLAGKHETTLLVKHSTKSRRFCNWVIRADR